MRLVGKLLNAEGELVGSAIELDDAGVITAIEELNGQEPEGWIVPGLIDIHCHGGGGASFPDDTTPQDSARAIQAHRSMGTTAMLASTVSLVDPIPAIKNLVLACQAGDLLGIHMEGPYISPHKIGAQNPIAVRNPDLDELKSWLEAGQGWIKTMTIAPEVENAVEAAQLLLDAGALPSWGHTSATMMQTRAAIAAGTQYGEKLGIKPAQTCTHLFNAMPSLHHREPGPIRELLAAARRGEVVLELVADAVHLQPEIVTDIVDFASKDCDQPNIAFVTDAMAGAGMADGDYVLGGQGVIIANGVARLKEGGAIAGGTSRLAEQLQRMVIPGHVSMRNAIRACVAGPAKALRLDGSEPGVTLKFKVGDKANLVALDENLQVKKVVREGQTL